VDQFSEEPNMPFFPFCEPQFEAREEGINPYVSRVQYRDQPTNNPNTQQTSTPTPTKNNTPIQTSDTIHHNYNQTTKQTRPKNQN
jgi:hypothetical protein